MSAGTAIRSRGTIIKVPDATPGLLIVNGQQLAFTLEGRWRSPVAPAANMAVEVDLDDRGTVAGLSVVDAQQIAREKLEQFGGVAQQQGKVAAEMARQGVGALAARMGTAPMVAAVALWVAWFFLPLVVIEFFGASRSVTLWQVLGLNTQNAFDQAGSPGLASLIGLLAIAAPFARPFVNHPRANYLNAMPLAFVLAAVVWLIYKISTATGNAGASQEVGSIIRELVSLGSGGYVIIASAGFLAILAFRSRK
jgi:hypothetical protein